MYATTALVGHAYATTTLKSVIESVSMGMLGGLGRAIYKGHSE